MNFTYLTVLCLLKIKNTRQTGQKFVGPSSAQTLQEARQIVISGGWDLIDLHYFDWTAPLRGEEIMDGDRTRLTSIVGHTSGSLENSPWTHQLIVLIERRGCLFLETPPIMYLIYIKNEIFHKYLKMYVSIYVNAIKHVESSHKLES